MPAPTGVFNQKKKYLIDNSYIYFNGHIYRQVIGIPMGINAGPQIANIYLHVYEYEYIKQLISIEDKIV